MAAQKSAKKSLMAELPLRTIKTTRIKSRFKRSDVRKAVLYAMSLRGAVPTPQKSSGKKAAASRK